MNNNSRTSQPKGLITLGILASALTLSCRNEDSQSKLKIIGGTPVEDGDPLVTHVAALVSPEDAVKCTAVAITASTFLTAGHCVFGQDLSRWTLQSGMIAGELEVLSIQSAEAHKNYNPSLTFLLSPSAPPFDIAVITTSEPSRALQPAAVISSGWSDQSGLDESLILSGYGRTEASDPESTGVLQKVSLTVTAFNDTAYEFTSIDGDAKMACHVDSGAPSFVKINGGLAVVGLVSRGDSNCRSGTTVFTNLTRLKDYTSLATQQISLDSIAP
jgi:secreted trypsin-like serine protease